MADVPYQSLYRRYRPQRFAEVRGQEHVTKALQNAVREDRVSHGYLFSGPRGTGKTSSARILAKALNCAKPDDGEPCGTCDSCVAVQQASSFDVHELDAASNNGVDAMRDLISRAALGTPGRWKVYIIDEVHMLSTAASNTLLKTLEEPPAHVVFVLATTEPQKVLPTIRSRVQHYQFGLLPIDDLSGLVAAVNADAGLGLTEADLDEVVRRGSGSARDTLSALDQASALGGIEAETPVAGEVIEAICERDPGRALVAVAEGVAAGRDPRRLGEEILDHLRDAFLASRAPQLVQRPEDEVARLAAQARLMGAATTVRAMELVGEALKEMKDAIDPRLSLEVAVVRVTAADADTSPAALLERIERLERRAPAAGAAATETDAPAPPVVERVAAPDRVGGMPASVRAAAGPATRPAAPAGRTPRSGPPPIPPRPGRAAAEPSDAPVPSDAAEPSDALVPSDVGIPSCDELTKAWGDDVLPTLRMRAKAGFAVGRFVDVVDGVAVFALPNEAHRRHCEPNKADIELALKAHFGIDIPVRLRAEDGVTGGPAPAPSGQGSSPADLPDDVSAEEVASLPTAPPGAASTTDRIKQAFPGAEEITP